jgi:hypothetical protein
VGNQWEAQREGFRDYDLIIKSTTFLVFKSRVEARHGSAFAGLLKRYFG